MTLSSSGILYFAEFPADRITAATLSGQISHVGGNAEGFFDGPLASAMFFNPTGVATDDNGHVYVADSENNRVRIIDSFGNVNTFAGSANGFKDGQGTAARFYYPRKLFYANNGVLYVADRENHAIRMISPSGYVTTLAGGGISHTYPGTLGFKDGQGFAAQFNAPHGMAFDLLGNMYVTDSFNNCIRKINTTGYVSTYAGNGTVGLQDGQGTDALFNYPIDITFDPVGSFLFVADRENQVIRLINSTGYVTTFAGTARTTGDTSGVKLNAEFNSPDMGTTIDADGTIYIVDALGGSIRKMS
jgi:DNA-binding beta-propeller fold protein YncE